MKNLHVVFTMNPSSEGLKDRAATSPALFNRYIFYNGCYYEIVYIRVDVVWNLLYFLCIVLRIY